MRLISIAALSLALAAPAAAAGDKQPPDRMPSAMTPTEIKAYTMPTLAPTILITSSAARPRSSVRWRGSCVFAAPTSSGWRPARRATRTCELTKASRALVVPTATRLVRRAG